MTSLHSSLPPEPQPADDGTHGTPTFAVGSFVTVLVGSKTGFHAAVEQIGWSQRDRCHYFYLTQPDRKLSRGYKADELAAASS